MDCPACGHALSPRTVGAVAVDACEGGCGGVWFDRFELRHVDEAAEAEGAALLDVERVPGRPHRERRRCPRCDDQPMIRHLFHPTVRVEVDQCPRCGGHWLDTGELGAIRERAGTDAEREAAARAAFATDFDEQLAAMRRRGGHDADEAGVLTRILRWVGAG